MIECKRNDILKLLEKIATETRLNLVHTDFEGMTERLRERYKVISPKRSMPLSDEYLYRKLFRKVQKPHQETLNLSPAILNAITQAIGYESYAHFLKASDPLSNPVIQNSFGDWYSYVRCNSGQPYVLRAPVRILEEKKEAKIIMQGSTRRFEGTVTAIGECLSCYLRSGESKGFHLVLKVASANNPQVIQGVFSGISTAGNPIAGREILIRQSSAYDTLTHDRTAIRTLLESSVEAEQRVGNYFSDKTTNIIRSGGASTFGLDDLVLE